VPHSDLIHRVGQRLDELVALPAAAACNPPPGARAGLIVTLSGGPDSVALLLACQAWGTRTGRPIAAAHLNHLLRGTAATADLDFCRDLCQSLDIPFFTESADPRPVARIRGQGLEEAGRHLRRQFCEGLLTTHPQYTWLATGHHRDDQIETVLMRLFRGTGPDGLRGIRPISGCWLHPMLGIDRAGIIAFLATVGQPWRTDASNLEGDNARARLRRELLPLLRDIFGAGCLDGPARFAELWDDELTLLDLLTDQWLADCLEPDGALRITGLANPAPAATRRVLRRWLANAGAEDVARVHIENIRVWLAEGVSGSTLTLPGALELAREFDRVSLRRSETGNPALRFAGDYRIVVAPAAAVDDPAGQGYAEGAGDPADEATWRLSCPAAGLRGNLQVRHPRPGDRIRPFGLRGTKKLSDLLREHRVTRDNRKSVLVVADDEGILWVVGLARSERTRLLPSPARTVTISVVKRIDSNQTRDTN